MAIRRDRSRLFGIIGCPVKHSLSPCMHNAAFRRLKIPAAYLPFLIKRDKLKEALLAFRRSGISGFNVTIPFKSECIRYLDDIEPIAGDIGAVNTVITRGRRFIGYNTDYIGFIRSLREDLGFRPRGKGIFILGAGGAARAAAFGLAREGARALYIYDPIRAKALSLKRDIRKNFKDCGISVCSEDEISKYIDGCGLLVNCTPLGMKKADPVPIPPRYLHKGLCVYDIVYAPPRTKLIRAARQKGLKAAGGIGMLLYQGAAAFEIWTGRKAPVGLMKKELLDNL